MNRMLDEYMCHEPTITLKDLENVEEQAYTRGYMDCEYLSNFYKKKHVLFLTHAAVAIVFLIIGILFN
jgi:hypothetical protein